MIVFHSMRICNVFSPIIVLLYTRLEVDLERPPVKKIWPEVMGIILAVNAWMVPFLKKFGVGKENSLSPFVVSIDSPHSLGELVKEYSKRTAPDRRECSTGMVYEIYREGEEVDYGGPNIGNGAQNTAGVFKNHFQKIKKSEVDTDLNATENNAVEENTVNENTQE